MINDDKQDKGFMAMLEGLINEVFSDHNDTKSETTDDAPPVKEQPKTTTMYESIEDYTAQTGKRFRMTKKQKELGMTREEAFNQTFGDN
jgi:hypothetical protein